MSSENKIKPIAIHLPQFHPVPENDEWWGKGFTEWTNVTKAKPFFKGHYQPHLPADLGFYDLRLEESRIAQEVLAKEYGIYGFCYYHYWFNGKRLLNEPVDRKLLNPKEDLPFMLCWANENWSRRWDGGNNEILKEQHYSQEDAKNHAKELLKYFLDERYIRIDNKPFFSIYKPHLIPNAKEYIQIIRDEVYKTEKVELYIAGFDTGALYDDKLHQLFEAIIEFQPQSNYLWNFMKLKLSQYHNWKFRKLYNYLQYKIGNYHVIHSKRINAQFHLDYSEYVDYLMQNYKIPLEYKLYPCVNPMWDNTARRKKEAFLFLNENPEKFEEWVSFHSKNFTPFSKNENFLFVNAWNEWAEGNHLEPCQKWGHQYLTALMNGLNKF